MPATSHAKLAESAYLTAIWNMIRAMIEKIHIKIGLGIR